ncbi:hypothetical protein ABEH27_25530 [Pseudomonas sp. P39-UII1]|uniref:hypothetical protein n=1 Tax=unclassified Pseudomonas TaxID=196821 RepID=UPI0032097274
MPISIKLGILALPLLLSNIPQAVYAAAQEGTILILDKDNAQCSLTVPGEGTGKRVQYEFNLPDSDCKEIKPRRIKFDGLPSAAQIFITDGYGCGTQEGQAEGDDTRNFWVKLRTTRKLTSSDWYEFDDLVSYPKDEIISPGLQMLDKNVKQSNLARDSTSCVRVITSSTTPPPTPVPATLNESTFYGGLKPRDEFKCGLNQVMIGRGHRGDEQEQQSTYTCATFKQGSTDLSRSNDKWEERFVESDGIYFMCPPDTVMSGRDHWNDENGETRYLCSELKNGDQKLSVLWSDGWSKSQKESGSSYVCPTGEFLVGRFHDDDEHGPTRYRCATAQ